MKPFQPSRIYGFVRSRQLEGSYPGNRRTGVWPITSFRIMRGWGCPSEGAWPYPSPQDAWPPSEPPEIDAQAENFRIGWYQRVSSLEDCKRTIAAGQGVLVSLDVWDRWADARNGRIPKRSTADMPLGTHAVTLEGYSNVAGEFRFANSWGPDWGDRGYGYIGYALLESIWWEGWTFTPPIDAPPCRSRSKLSEIEWAVAEPCGGILHCREIVDNRDARIGWAFGLEHNGVLHVEELFVKPQFRGAGHGTRLLRSIAGLAERRNSEIRMWVSYPDATPENLKIIDKLTHPLGLGLIPSGLRWAPIAGVAGFNTSPLVYELPHFEPPAAIVPDVWKSVGELFAGGTGFGFGAAACQLLYRVIQSRVDAKNGRRIRVKLGELELETTQHTDEEFLEVAKKVMDLHTEVQIRSKLLEAGFRELH